MLDTFAVRQDGRAVSDGPPHLLRCEAGGFGHRGAAEVSAPKYGAVEVRSDQLGAPQVGATEVRVLQVGCIKTRIPEVCLREKGALEVGFRKISPSEV
jgi:hypothetical protein